MEATKKTVSLIIPAHNEEDNIGRVLDVAVSVPEIDEILVVADACQDNTEAVARHYEKVNVLVREDSRGKGDAMIDGVSHTRGDIILFADADLENLTVEHLQKILDPVICGQASMSIGLRDRIFGLGALIPKIFPMFAIGGERAMTRDFFNLIPKDQNTLDFGIETVMNYYTKKHQLKVAYPLMNNLHQVIKEKKWGFWKGFTSRLGLLWQVWRTRFIMKHRKDL